VPAKLVIAAAIIALAIGYFLGLWSDLGGWLNDLANFLAASTLVPNWLLGLFAICAIIVAGLLGAGLRPTRKSTDPEKNEPTE
jgi:ABC-type dipeptide/oligopeptide/nickel transport system permease component